MKKIFLLGLIFLSFKNFGQTAKFDSVGFVKDANGFIFQQSNEFIIKLDSNENVRYYPVNLDSSFRFNNLRIIFSGKIGKISPNARMIGTPLEITKIKRENRKEVSKFMKNK